MNFKKFLTGAALGALMLTAAIVPASADINLIDFEAQTYTVGNINGQDGWSKTDGYDVEVVENTYGFTTFDDQSLRISNAVTSSSFGDHTIAKPLVDSVGEADATAGTFAEGDRQTRFEMEFDLATTMAEQQDGLFMSVSPDRGDGSRMSYLGFQDEEDGVNVIFYDVQGTYNPANFVLTDLGTLDRETPHTIKLVMDVVDGPSNDVVEVFIDGVSVHTGTSWENYYRYDTEASAEQFPRIVRTVLFRVSGPAAAATLGEGYLVDNLTLNSSSEALVPLTKDECKKDGWMAFTDLGFKNQGACVSYVQSNDHAQKRI